MKSLITEDGSRTAYSEKFQQTYHSQYGALNEARQVYLENSGIADRLRAGKETSVLEIGFGLGLNFLVTAASAKKHQAQLDYTGIENALISPIQFKQLQYDSIHELEDVSACVDRILVKHQSGISPIREIEDHVALKIIPENAQSIDFGNDEYHAVYLDAFSPDVNPELWTETFLVKLHACLIRGGTLTTYCVKGCVRRSLETVGFQLEKKTGPRGKREVLLAVRQ